MVLSLIVTFGVGIVLGLSFVRVTIVGYASYGAIAGYQVLVGEQTIAGLFEFFVLLTTEQVASTALATGLILLYITTPLLMALVVSATSEN